MKKLWKAIEQLGHFLMAGIPAGGLAYGLNFILPWQAALALGIALGIIGIPYCWGIAREITQNWNDGRDEKTLFMISKLPVNMNMVWDIIFYVLGSVILSTVGVLV